MPGYPEGLLKNRAVVKHGNYAVITPEGRYWYRGGINPAAVKEYRLVGYENRRLREEDFNNDRVDDIAFMTRTTPR